MGKYEQTKIRFGFKGRNQFPLFMIFREYWCRESVVYAKVIFNSMDWIGR